MMFTLWQWNVFGDSTYLHPINVQEETLYIYPSQSGM